MEEKNIDVTIASNSKNKTFDFHKVFSTIGVILVVGIIILGGVWYFAVGQHSDFFDDEDSTVKVSTSSAKTATKSASQSATKSADN